MSSDMQTVDSVLIKRAVNCSLVQCKMLFYTEKSFQRRIFFSTAHFQTKSPNTFDTNDI